MLKNCGLEQKYRNFNFFVHSSHLSLLLLFFRNYTLLLSLYPCGLACWKRHRSPHIFSIDEVASQSSSCFAFFGQHLNNGVFETSLNLTMKLTHIQATSPARRGQFDVRIRAPEAWRKAVTISRTLVPVPVPRLNVWKPACASSALKAARWPLARSTTWM